MNTSIIGGADGPSAIYLAGSIGDMFAVPAAFILIVFYGIYLVKMSVQRKKGIQTVQLGRGEKPARRTESLLQAASVLAVLVQILSIVLEWNGMPSAVRMAGILIGGLGDIVFLTAVLSLKDSWRVGIPQSGQTELVTAGIYRYSRNPAFLGFYLMYAGILLAYFNWVLFAVTAWAMLMLHLQVLQEEAYLKDVFGEKYTAYQAETCRYFGRKR